MYVGKPWFRNKEKKKWDLLDKIELTWHGLGQFVYLFNICFFHDFLLPNFFFFEED